MHPFIVPRCLREQTLGVGDANPAGRQAFSDGVNELADGVQRHVHELDNRRGGIGFEQFTRVRCGHDDDPHATRGRERLPVDDGMHH